LDAFLPIRADRPLTFPAPKKVEEQLGVTTVSTETGETETTPTTTAEEPAADPEAGKELFAANACQDLVKRTEKGTSTWPESRSEAGEQVWTYGRGG
jgi:hypothetical protein